MTVKEFFKLYDKKHTFAEESLRDLWWGDLLEDAEIENVTDVEYEEPCRWSHFEGKVVKIQDRYFSIGRWAGNTEYQEDNYDVQPLEVKPVEKIVTITEWQEV